MDAKIVQVALNGLENILRLGEQDAKNHNGTNPYAVLIEECYGMNVHRLSPTRVFNGFIDSVVGENLKWEVVVCTECATFLSQYPIEVFDLNGATD